MNRDGLGCACVDNDAYECWRRRYHLFPSEDVEEDGGPCGCPCHDGYAMERFDV